MEHRSWTRLTSQDAVAGQWTEESGPMPWAGIWASLENSNWERLISAGDHACTSRTQQSNNGNQMVAAIELSNSIKTKSKVKRRFRIGYWEQLTRRKRKQGPNLENICKLNRSSRMIRKMGKSVFHNGLAAQLPPDQHRRNPSRTILCDFYPFGLMALDFNVLR